METRVQETQGAAAAAAPETPEILPVVKKIKTETQVTQTVAVPKIQPRVVATAESHWEKLLPEIQEKIQDMAARAVHREKLNKVCEEEEFLWIDRCFVCQKEEWGMLWTPCCRKTRAFGVLSRTRSYSSRVASSVYDIGYRRVRAARE